MEACARVRWREERRGERRASNDWMAGSGWIDWVGKIWRMFELLLLLMMKMMVFGYSRGCERVEQEHSMVWVVVCKQKME